ncbi:ABC transporter permease [Actinomadura rubrisoli]|uniref:ABC transporter permease n=1 Tax=Actinomadura rubrisoli TaxID=2530368 RepID=A0A4R5CDV8_9ACTN|nr:ABC transporter permease [Actinomadura rubrisoli]TDD96423.1 ABC transporter permease [Actinomadura rubrisoli]
MIAYIVRRLLVNVLVFLFISLGVFLLVRAAPGDPVRMMVNPEQLQAGGPEFLARKRAELGLDRSIAVQYGQWLGGALTGDLGFSYVSGRPVTTVLGERLGPTVLLMGTALLIGLAIAVPVGVLAAVRKNGPVDYTAAVLSLSTISIPSFFLGIVGIYVFALKLGWLPSAGMSTPGGGGPADTLRHLVLPVTILALSIAGPFVRYVRSGMLAELSADYIRTVEARGAGRMRVLFRHALRNALIPLITVLMIYIPQLLGGAVVLEQVFAWPGMGQLAVSSIGQLDYPVVVGFALYTGVLVLLCNLAADLFYAVADPRIELR